jgi:hypothetical protein
MVRTGGAEHLHHACQGSVRAGPHIQRFAGQPDGINANHRRTSRSHAAHSTADDIGQLTVAVTGPRRNSMRSSVTSEAMLAAVSAQERRRRWAPSQRCPGVWPPGHATYAPGWSCMFTTPKWMARCVQTASRCSLRAAWKARRRLDEHCHCRAAARRSGHALAVWRAGTGHRRWTRAP